MSNKIGRFEIVSQLAQSPFATIHKALDTETQQTVALKVLRLDQVKDSADLLKRVFEEADQAKPLNSHNIATLYGVGDEDGLLLAASEYVQGNSVATTLARKDGFSIWDLQDIVRQVCQALDHAQGHKVLHQSLEPAKVMVQWDGLVKVLGFGISSMSAGAANAASVPETSHYASPEKVRGETCDHRSALFSLGAILYEMATDQKAFPGETADQVREAILEKTPPLPVRLKPNVNSALSGVIMKAIAKLPAERYQSGQELVKDLEQCTAAPVSAISVAPLKAKAHAAAVGGVSSPVTKPNVPPKAMASAAVEPPAAPSFKVDPMMAAEAAAELAPPSTSFSEISELPPLKEIVIAAPPPREEPEEVELQPMPVLRKSVPEKPKIQVRESAQKAVAEIRKTPPKLFIYALGGAVALIAVIVGGITLSNYLQDRVPGGSGGAQIAERQIPPKLAPALPPAPPQPEATPAQTSQPDAVASEADQTASQAPTVKGRKSKSRAAAAVVPAQLSVSSDPAGAQIAFDGSLLCQSPCTLTGIAPGQHVISASKTGYNSESRTITLTSGANSSVALPLSQPAAMLSVASTPAGAAIVIDGRDTGKLTPSQFTFEKTGTHAVILRRYGYLEESSSINTEAGQTSSVNVVLKSLGSTDEIRSAGGKFKKVFGGGAAAEMGIVSVKTQPKGAQIMVNNRVLDKTAPFDFYLNPGTYVIDITMSGYRSLHRVIKVEQREKVAIEETLSPE